MSSGSLPAEPEMVMMQTSSATHMSMGVLGGVVHSASLFPEMRVNGTNGSTTTTGTTTSSIGDYSASYRDGALYRPMGGGVGMNRKRLQACGYKQHVGTISHEKGSDVEVKKGNVTQNAVNSRGMARTQRESHDIDRKLAFKLAIPTHLLEHLTQESIQIINDEKVLAHSSTVDASWELAAVNNVAGIDDGFEMELAIAYVENNHMHFSWTLAYDLPTSQQDDMPDLLQRYGHCADPMQGSAFGVSLCKSRCRNDDISLCAVHGVFGTSIYEAMKRESETQDVLVQRIVNIDASGATVAANWNPHWSDEIVLLNREGQLSVSNLGNPNSFIASTNIKEQTFSKWLDCMFAPQSPRSIMALSERSIRVYDIRDNAPSTSISLANVLHPLSYTSGVDTFLCMACPSPFSSISPWPVAVATSNAIHILDMRKASIPLLSWEWNNGYKTSTSPFLQLHFNDNCTAGDRWLDKVFTRKNDDINFESLYGAVTIAHTVCEPSKSLRQSDSTYERSSIITTSSAYYMPLCRENSPDVGRGALLPNGVGWHGMNNPILVDVNESYDCSQGCVILGSSNSSNEKIWGDAMMIGCDKDGQAWFQRLICSQYHDKRESAEATKDRRGPHTENIAEVKNYLTSGESAISFAWTENLQMASSRNKTKSSGTDVPLSDRACTWRLTSLACPSTKKEHDQYRLFLDTRDADDYINDTRIKKFKKVSSVRQGESRQKVLPSAQEISTITIVPDEDQNFVDKADATLILGKRMSADSDSASDYLQKNVSEYTSVGTRSLAISEYWSRQRSNREYSPLSLDKLRPNPQKEEYLRQEWDKMAQNFKPKLKPINQSRESNRESQVERSRSPHALARGMQAQRPPEKRKTRSDTRHELRGLHLDES